VPYTGGQILVKALRHQGVDRVYCVPGESYLPVLDAFYDLPEISVVSARHEGAAANMAEADGKLTGRPGVCFVTRGPGATHASVGVHTAFQDSTPMVLFIGQVARDVRDREGFQEVDFRAMFAPLAKWVAEIDHPARICEYVARAFRAAVSGRPGPVVLSLPEDMLAEAIETTVQLAPAALPARAVPRNSDLQTLGELLKQSLRPLLIVGGTGWSREGCAALAQFVRRNDLPVIASFRRQDLLDNRSDNYCGHLTLGVDPALAERVKAADLILAIGSRLGEVTTSGYSLLTPPISRQTLIQVHPDPDELGRVYQPGLAIACGLSEFTQALSSVDVGRHESRRTWLHEARQAHVRFATPPARSAGALDLASIIGWLSDNVAEDAIIANGAGNYTVWVHRYFRYRQPRTELAPVSGSMGYGVPAAVAAKLRHPDREVIAFAGDGCFLMYPQELGTAVQHSASVIVLVINNGKYGTIRMHQERHYPGRVIATDIMNPDFVALARSFGAFAERVEATERFPDAYRRAQAARRPALLELRVDPEQLTPSFRVPSSEPGRHI
jgi:acetolactate synthase I/II/III large subunit